MIIGYSILSDATHHAEPAGRGTKGTAVKIKSLSDLDFTITLDASRDLYEGGYNTKMPEPGTDGPNGGDAEHEAREREQADFSDAYSQCAAKISEVSGVRISINEANYEGPDAVNISEDEFGHDVWQAIHDCISFDEESQEYQYSEAKAEKIGLQLKEEAAELVHDLFRKKSEEKAREAIEEMLNDELSDLSDELATAAKELLIGRVLRE